MARNKRFKDLVGQRFGKYVVISHVLGQHWNCRCDCGAEKVHFSPNLLTGQVTMCRGCSDKARIIDIIGQKFGKWTVLKHVKKSEWLCRCDCGTEAVCLGGNLKNGGSTKCEKCRLADRHKPKHGHCPADGFTPTYQVWVSIKSRCDTKLSPYGGKGVCICQGWRADFSNFLASMGERPSVDVSIDRANKDESTRHYSCGKCDECKKNGWVLHCRWATQSEQMRNVSTNRWITYNGKTMILADWSRELGIPVGTLRYRLFSRKWSTEKSLGTPHKPKN